MFTGMSDSSGRQISPDPTPDIVKSTDVPVATAASIKTNRGKWIVYIFFFSH